MFEASGRSSSTLVCFAVREEAKFFKVPPERVKGVDLLITGMGARNAKWALEKALQRTPAALVLTCGFAGGLNPGLPGGALLYADEEGTGIGAILADLGASPGSFYCESRILTSAREKNELWRRTGADAVEMESGVIREICRQRQIPSATVRVISDAAAEELPVDFNALLTEKMEIHYGKLAWLLARSPARVRGLLQLQQRTKAAAQKLGQALQELLRRQARAAR
jgi:adenosylhomocysteine nucleosidase